MPVKRCPKCGEEKELTTEFWYKRKGSSDGFRGKCKVCMDKESADYQIKYKDTIRIYRRKWDIENPEKRVMANVKWLNGNRLKRKESVNNYARKQVKVLSNQYLIVLLRRWFRGKVNIPPELIELKRQQIIMKRNLKQFKKWREEKEDESDHEYVSGEQQENEENYGRELQSRADSTGAARV